MIPYNFLFMQHTISFIQQSGNEPPCWVPINKATGHPRWQNVNKRKNDGITKRANLEVDNGMLWVSCSKCCKIEGSG